MGRFVGDLVNCEFHMRNRRTDGCIWRARVEGLVYKKLSKKNWNGFVGVLILRNSWIAQLAPVLKSSIYTASIPLLFFLLQKC